MIKIGINGFGRIGRQVFKAFHDYYSDKVEVVAINDITDTPTLAHLLKYDSNYGRFEGSIEATSEFIKINGKSVKVYSQKDPALIPWEDTEAELIIESTGRFTHVKYASTHIKGRVKKVLISSPAKGEDITLVLGVNHQLYNYEKHHIISMASCTTNSLAPVSKVLLDYFGIEKGLMSTIHAYTNDQRILDLPHDDLRRARAAAINLIPTSTGAAKAISLVLPALEGKMHGIALRVPLSTVSLTDLTVVASKNTTITEVNEAFKNESLHALKGVLGYTEEPLVSSDFKGTTYSTVVDGISTVVIGGNLIKVLAWYDNEWGYAVRLADAVIYVMTGNYHITG
ncbi:MAG: Glyceraldehyde-3-phosphate dehydrogenase 1 [candidate division WS2 bacterium]|uniref:Glyceraldehyde-3-phosphate dehydrogenase n=1 Tax=Psychracetigena formicireducens TaxID=2986056 RepID=A0A9E2BFT1_PSYF1|nr:Glyceraldehyde-3-phosphate dehydrogenase 1 [Candidatus Psychracetigena formicireducens]MBT9144169.1 Glyceraldehyde-3-phosphate dehydrogenase 1 [Candidatus Psychracetigena formicireducens]MBT9150009.1 Glyceraldehyde-3-phosphate dehydrogenase 1 [Candidatus Psychracetigena formicireducens]